MGWKQAETFAKHGISLSAVADDMLKGYNYRLDLEASYFEDHKDTDWCMAYFVLKPAGWQGERMEKHTIPAYLGEGSLEDGVEKMRENTDRLFAEVLSEHLVYYGKKGYPYDKSLDRILGDFLSLSEIKGTALSFSKAEKMTEERNGCRSSFQDNGIALPDDFNAVLSHYGFCLDEKESAFTNPKKSVAVFSLKHKDGGMEETHHLPFHCGTNTEAFCDRIDVAFSSALKNYLNFEKKVNYLHPDERNALEEINENLDDLLNAVVHGMDRETDDYERD